MSEHLAATVALTHNLAHSWGDRALFERMNLEISAGVTLVRGDEQSGKTTLLRILAGDVGPTTGWVTTNGVRSDGPSNAYAQQVFRTDPTNAALDQTSPARWFKTLPSRYPSLNPEVLAELVQAFGLAPHADKPLYMLSAGSRRKVWLSAAFASGAALVLIDQPFAALDAPSVRLLRELLQDMAAQSARACLIADYEAPNGVPLVGSIEL
jgi:ABC-type multidrug transport system ATPase subunit